MMKDGLRRFILFSFTTVACYLVSFVIFAPRLWRFANASPDSAETGRGICVLVQLDNPHNSYPVGGETLEWRLLFPVIGHAVHMDPHLFLALPMIFCAVLLVYVMYLVYGETKSFSAAVAVTALTSTTSTIFVSTGLLGYFDSALMLALLVAAFSRRDMTLWLAAVLAPWIDERFIFALPIIIWIQWLRTKKFSCLRPLLLGVAPYLVLRLIAYLTHSETVTQSYINDIFAGHHNVVRVLWGFWDSLRWGWIAVVAAFWVAMGATQSEIGSAFIKKCFAFVCMFFPVVMVTLSNGDYSRSTAIALPLMIFGCLLIYKNFSQRRALWFLWILALMNFVTPAFHSFRAFRIHIKPLPFQLHAPASGQN